MRRRRNPLSVSQDCGGRDRVLPAPAMCDAVGGGGKMRSGYQPKNKISTPPPNKGSSVLSPAEITVTVEGLKRDAEALRGIGYTAEEYQKGLDKAFKPLREGGKMTATEFLRQYLDADRALDCKLEQLARLRAKAAKITTIISGERVQGGIEGSRLEAIVERIVELERDIEQDIEQLKRKQSDVEAMILRLDSDQERDVLTLKYIYGYRWEEIVQTSNYSRRQVFRLHGTALQKIDFFLKDGTKWH